MKLLAIDQFVSVFKLVTYFMLVGMSFLFMGMQISIGPVLLFGSVGLILAHIVHQCLFNRRFSQKTRVLLFTLAGCVFFGIIGSSQLNLRITATLLTGFSVSFIVDLFTERYRNRISYVRKRSAKDFASKEFIPNRY